MRAALLTAPCYQDWLSSSFVSLVTRIKKQSIFVSAFAIEQQQQQQQSWPDVEVRQKLFAEKLVEIFFRIIFEDGQSWTEISKPEVHFSVLTETRQNRKKPNRNLFKNVSASTFPNFVALGLSIRRLRRSQFYLLLE